MQPLVLGTNLKDIVTSRWVMHAYPAAVLVGVVAAAVGSCCTAVADHRFVVAAVGAVTDQEAFVADVVVDAAECRIQQQHQEEVPGDRKNLQEVFVEVGAHCRVVCCVRLPVASHLSLGFPLYC